MLFKAIFKQHFFDAEKVLKVTKFLLDQLSNKDYIYTWKLLLIPSYRGRNETVQLIQLERYS